MYFSPQHKCNGAGLAVGEEHDGFHRQQLAHRPIRTKLERTDGIKANQTIPSQGGVTHNEWTRWMDEWVDD